MTPQDLLRKAAADLVFVDRLLDVSTVAKREGVSQTTVRNWIAAGKLTAERTIGGHYRIRLSMLLAAKKATEAQESQGLDRST